MKEIELCRLIVSKVNSIQEQCKEIISNTTKIVDAHSAVLDSCKANYNKVQCLQDVCRDLLLEVDNILTRIESEQNPVEDAFNYFPDDFFLPPATTATKPNPAPVNDKVDAALKCLSQLHIVGMSPQTVLAWPFQEAPKALREIAYAVGLNTATWVAVISRDVNSKWLDSSPFKAGYGLKFSTGHEVLYGLA